MNGRKIKCLPSISLIDCKFSITSGLLNNNSLVVNKFCKSRYNFTRGIKRPRPKTFGLLRVHVKKEVYIDFDPVLPHGAFSKGVNVNYTRNPSMSKNQNIGWHSICHRNRGGCKIPRSEYFQLTKVMVVCPISGFARSRYL